MRTDFLASLSEDQACLLYACVNKGKELPVEWELFKCVKTIKAAQKFSLALPFLKEEHKILAEELRLKLLDEIKTVHSSF